MIQTIDCSVVRDLLPNYIEKLTSNETNEILEEHFNTCTQCEKERAEMLCEFKADKMPENQDLKKYLNKTKQMYLLKGIALSIAIIGIIVSFIVDIAVNRKLTWSIIVDLGIVFIYAIIFTAILCKKNKVVKTLAMLSILIVPLLYGIEYVVNTNYLNKSIPWVNEYALPICFIWLGILWLTAIIKYMTKTNIWNMIGILLILTIFGDTITDSIAQNISFTEAFLTGVDWIDSIVYLICAILCFIVGALRKDKNRR
ncbi:MAG: hypothetical protein ACERKZ_09550 [Lachnotalea sp.]